MSERQELTDELRRQLAGYLPFSPKASVKYTPAFFLRRQERWNAEKEQFISKDEKGADLPYLIPDGYRPEFLVRSFTKEEYELAGKIMQEEISDKDNKNLMVTMNKTRELVRHVVIGWHDFWDIGTCEDIEYKADPDGGALKELWSVTRMPDWVYGDIRNFVYRLSGITPGERLSLR